MGWFSSIAGNLGSIGSVVGGIAGAFAGNPAAGAAIGGSLGKLGEGAFDGGKSGAEAAYDAANPEYFKYDPNKFTLGVAGSGKFDVQQSNEVRKRQMALADALEARANGKAPSIADQQAGLARQSLFSQGLSSVASQRGPNSAAAQRNLLNALATGNQNIGAQAGIQRLQEQQMTQQQLADILSGTRSQDLAASTGEYNARLAQLQADQELQRLQGGDALSRSAIRARLAPDIAGYRTRQTAANESALSSMLGAGLGMFGGNQSSASNMNPGFNPSGSSKMFLDWNK